MLIYGGQSASLPGSLSGCIYYSPGSDPTPTNTIVRWDVRRRRKSLEIHLAGSGKPEAWDVEGDLLAWAQKTSTDPPRAELRVARLPHGGTGASAGESTRPRAPGQFTVNASKVLFRAEHVDCLDISPDQKRIAAIVSHEEHDPDGSVSWSDFRLLILDVETGKPTPLPAAAPAPFCYGICWLPDSRRIVYCVFGENRNAPPASPFARLKWLLRAPPYGDRLQSVLYLVDLNSGSARRIGRGAWPTSCGARRTIIARESTFGDDPYLLLYSFGDNAVGVRARRVPFIGHDAVQASPDGRALLGCVKPPVVPFVNGPFALVDWDHPLRRHALLPEGMLRPFTRRVWTTCP